MKLFSKFLLTLALVAGVGFVALADKYISSNDLPNAAKAFINKNYNGVNIYHCEKDGSEYDVDLSNGVDLKFNKKGKLLKIETDRGVLSQAVLKAILPAKAIQHLNNKGLVDRVDEVEFRRNSIVVDIDNYDDFEIRFRLDGTVK